MSKAQDVQFWSIRHRPNRRKPWEVRWRVENAKFSRSRVTKTLAEHYRNDLMQAARQGEVFSLSTGEPVAWERSEMTAYTLARRFMAARWAESSANTRLALVRSLVPIVLGTLDVKADKRRRPERRTLRRALSHYAFRPPAWDGDGGEISDAPDDIIAALEWVASASRPVADLDNRAAMRELLGRISLGAKGQRLAHASIRGRRASLHALLDFAVELELFPDNPLNGVKTKRRRANDAVDPRRVPSLSQARALLAAAGEADGHLAAFFAVLYYAGMRPGEVRALRSQDCTLPRRGWGSLLLAGTVPEVAAEWCDGDRWDPRELKHRAPGEVRPVPIPPVLVAILRAHIDEHGTAPDGRLFWEGDEQTPVRGVTYRRVWQQARQKALNATERASGLAARPYDLRHGNASLLLNNNVPATEVARRLGHSVQMLFTTYAHWFSGMEAAANAAIDVALADDNALTCENSDGGPPAGQKDADAGS